MVMAQLTHLLNYHSSQVLYKFCKCYVKNLCYVYNVMDLSVKNVFLHKYYYSVFRKYDCVFNSNLNKG